MTKGETDKILMPINLVSRKKTSGTKACETYMMSNGWGTPRYIVGITEKQSKNHYKIMSEIKKIVLDGTIRTKAEARIWIASMLKQ